jgi:3-oxoacyl-[acyl-carrier-protein] synthase-1
MSRRIAFHTATSAAGAGLEALRTSIGAMSSGLRPNDFDFCALGTWIGRVPGIESVALPSVAAGLDSRNNRLAWLGLQQDDFLTQLEATKSAVGPARIGVIIGTSTSSIGRTEEAYRGLPKDGRFASEYLQPEVHNIHSPGHFIALVTGLHGPAITISTACSSSAKVFATADRWIKQGLIDAALVGGVDSLCLNTLYGFNSLELISANPCRPFDRRREGINLGEAAAFALVARSDQDIEGDFSLLGYGESSDAYHMSHPHPEGYGAFLAMDQAIRSAGLGPHEIDYINLHGTATQANDSLETLALARIFNGDRGPERGRRPLASSTKGWTGHTLGASGMMEAVITLEAMRMQVVPGTLNCEEPDESLHYPVQLENREFRIRTALSNSFGFGGNNASLAFGIDDD